MASAKNSTIQENIVMPPLKNENSDEYIINSRNFKNDWKISDSVGGAINRTNGFQPKEMPSNYYQGVPAFMRSDGPFTVYNHHKIKGEEHYENAKLTKSNAKKRVKDQLEQLRLEKEEQKKLFTIQIQSEEENFKIQQQLKKL